MEDGSYNPPCSACRSGDHDCVLAGSRRGGDFSHRRAAKQAQRARQRSAQPALDSSSAEPAGHRGSDTSDVQAEEAASIDPGGSTGDSGCIQNPFQALQMLVRGASVTSPGGNSATSPDGVRTAAVGSGQAVPPDLTSETPLASYVPIANGSLCPRLLDHLLQQ